MASAAPQERPHRLGLLHRPQSVDREPADAFDRLARLAATAYAAPVAFLVLLDGEEPWLKAAIGTDRGAGDPEEPLYRTAADAPGILAVPDLLGHPRLRDSPLVTAGPRLRACLAAPVSGGDGAPLGALVVLDHRVRSDFAADRAGPLDDAAALAEALLGQGPARETDPVTGCATRRAFLERLAREARQSARVGRPVALVLVDVDQYDATVARHGPETGEDVLRGVAERLRGVLREADLLAWTGGESFAALLPFANPGRAEMMARRMRSRVAATPVETGAGPLPLTVSIGVSGPQEAGGRHEGMVAAAALECARARAQGGDRVRVAPPFEDGDPLARAMGG